MHAKFSNVPIRPLPALAIKPTSARCKTRCLRTRLVLEKKISEWQRRFWFLARRRTKCISLVDLDEFGNAAKNHKRPGRRLARRGMQDFVARSAQAHCGDWPLLAPRPACHGAATIRRFISRTSLGAVAKSTFNNRSKDF